jgi:hypothetical protein
MADWGSYIDRQIRKAIEDGEFSNLPGEGKPLNLGDDAHTPEELRMAYKILKDNDLSPEWIMHGKALDAKIDDMMEQLGRAASRYQAASQAPDATAASRGQAETAWRTAQAKLTGAAAKLNGEISTYNLKIPRGAAAKPLLNLQREINRLTGS